MPGSEAWTAIGTVAMAVTTFAVVMLGLWNRKDDERRHRDGLRPICVLTPYDGVDPRPYRSDLLGVETDPSRPGFGIVVIRCALRNVGPGPALNVRIAFRLYSLGGYETEGCELGPLHAGEFRGSVDEPLRVAIFLRDPLRDQEFGQIPGGSWEIILTYDDVFEQSFYSMHPKHSFQMNRLYRESGAEKFTAPSQSWVTLGKGKPPAQSGAGLLVGFTGAKETAWQSCTRILQRTWGFFFQSHRSPVSRKNLEIRTSGGFGRIADLDVRGKSTAAGFIPRGLSIRGTLPPVIA